MMLIVKLYNDLLYNDKDTRCEDFWLMDSIIPTCFASLSYIIICKYIGPKLMEKRKPYQLKTVLFWYNLLQVLYSAYIFYEVFDIEWFTTSKILKCQSVDYSANPRSMRTLRAFYLYYLVKFVEYLDTFFFVLRKKNNQISFLHIYHHASMPLYMWFVTKSFAGGSWILIPFVNSFIHVVMYTYYLLAGLGPEVQKYLWWKKYITVLQLIQFVIGIIHFIFVLFDTSPTCKISKPFIATASAVGLFFYFLFRQFYKQAYVEKGSTNVQVHDVSQNGKSPKILSNDKKVNASKLH